jgi:hypothetical protein
MAIRTLPLHLSWRDAKGFIGRTSFWVSGDAVANSPTDFTSAADTLQAAIVGLTNCAFAGGSGVDFFNPQTLTYGANAEYASEWMKAVMTFSTDLATISRFKIPAPEIDLFDTDGVTILNDGTQAQVVAFVNAVKNADASGTYISTKQGQPYTHFVGGILRLGKQPRRFNEFIKSSHLVQGEGE